MLEQAVGPILTAPVAERRDHIIGPRTALVTLVEYGDFECPHCGEAHFYLKDMLERAGEKVRLVFRHFPLTQVHPHAQRAAEAAEAAGEQGQFWEMHDLLFENQDALDDYDLVKYAEALGLDMVEFRARLLQGDFTARVREDFLTGVRSGVNGTPTFFVNGRRHDGAWDVDALIGVMENETPGHGKAGRTRGR